MAIVTKRVFFTYNHHRKIRNFLSAPSFCIQAGVDLGGGADAASSGIGPPVDPKGPPFDTFSKIHFWPTDTKIFLKAPLAPIYTNFEGERAPKKTRFLSKFFKNLPAAQKI